MIGQSLVILESCSKHININWQKMQKLKEYKLSKLYKLKILMNSMNSLLEDYLILKTQSISMKTLGVEII
jgi:hypothetical protein